MGAPNKIYLAYEYSEIDPLPPGVTAKQVFGKDVCYIRKDALLEWAEKELERLYELIPDAHKVEDETATPMEIRYLGQYMQMESVIDKLNEM